VVSDSPSNLISNQEQGVTLSVQGMANHQRSISKRAGHHFYTTKMADHQQNFFYS
jgi:hypothetical protein